jgi:galactose-1-phosphate uridylyltransferase
MTNKGTKMAKLTRTEIAAVLQHASEITREHYNSYAYAAGMFQVQLELVVATLPRHKQLEVLSIIKNVTSQYEQKVA